MIYIYIFADSHKHFKKPIDEYLKRLSKKIKLVELAPIKKGSASEIIQKETEIIYERLASLS